jgi:L-iditol 2-dehydrogenase
VNSSFSDQHNEWATSLHFMSVGKLHVKPLISHRITLAETPGMFHKMYGREVTYNKIIILPWAEEVNP